MYVGRWRGVACSMSPSRGILSRMFFSDTPLRYSQTHGDFSKRVYNIENCFRLVMMKTEIVLGGVISGILAFWVAHHVSRLIADPLLSGLAYALSQIPAPPNHLNWNEIFRVALRLPSSDLWFTLILLGGLFGALLCFPSENTSEYAFWRIWVKRIYWLCLALFFLLLVGVNILEAITTGRLNIIFSLTGLLSKAAWIGLGMLFGTLFERFRNILMERWLL